MQETALGPPPAPPDGYHSRRRRSWCTVVIAGCCSPHGATAMNPVKPSPLAASQEAAAVPRDTLTLTDNRTGKQYEIPITHNTIRALDLRQIKVHANEFGMMSYDPAFTNTAACISRITFIDGDAGILRYRGYPIEELAEKSSYLETAYLILYGELPTKAQLEEWIYHITHHTFIHESIKKFLDGFHYDAHPMGMMISTIAALSTFYPDAKDIFNAESRRKQTWRLIGKMPTLAAFAYRHSLGMPYAYPDNELSYAGNFLNMLFKTTELKYRPNATLERALDILFILHADHEQNCSANAMRCVGSSHVDPYSGLIYQSMGFPVSMFPVLFAIPRTSGWIAQWEEMLLDPEQKIARPRQIYLGHDKRSYVPIDRRG